MTALPASLTIEPSSALTPRQKLLRLLGLGVILWLLVVYVGSDTVGIQLFTSSQLRVAALALLVLAVPALRRRLIGIMAAARHPSPRARRWTGLGVFFGSAAYLVATALHQHRDFFPKYHDEFMHLTEMQLIAHGRLWLPQHPMADFFETFHVLVKPVYCGIHFPGVALLYAPAVWLHAPAWVGPLLVAVGAATLTYLVIGELLDGWFGLLAVGLLLSLQQYRFVSLMVMSNLVTLTMGLGMVWAYLRWRESRKAKWAVLVGILAGWCAITRPPDAACFALPIGVAILWELRGNMRHLFVVSLAILLGAVPFLALQVIFDLGVTGKMLLTPYSVYADTFNPGVNYGFRARSAAEHPATDLPQKQLYYTRFVLPNLENHTPAKALPMAVEVRLPLMFKSTLPATMLLVLLPAGVWWLTRRSRIGWVLGAVLPLYFLVYTFQAMLAPFYVVFAIPAALLIVLAGAKGIEHIAGRIWPGARGTIAAGLTLFVVAMSVAAIPEVDAQTTEQFPMPTLAAVREKLAHIQTPALVLFTFHPTDNLHEEPVYNIQTANPDDAPIVRAQDLGPRNIELFRYYARIQPQRHVYRFDRRDRTLQDLGPVTTLAN